jgi:hypothetical protein
MSEGPRVVVKKHKVKVPTGAAPTPGANTPALPPKPAAVARPASMTAISRDGRRSSLVDAQAVFAAQQQRQAQEKQRAAQLQHQQRQQQYYNSLTPQQKVAYQQQMRQQQIQQHQQQMQQQQQILQQQQVMAQLQAGVASGQNTPQQAQQIKAQQASIFQ